MKLEQLVERRLGRAAAERAAAALSDVRIGMEFEFAVAKGSPLYQEDQYAASMQLKRLDNIDEVESYFEAPSRSTWVQIAREYEEWVEEQKQNWIDDNWELYAPDDDEIDEREREDAGREAAADRVESKLSLEQTDWIYDTKGNWYNLIAEYGLTPAFGWYEERGDDRSSFYTEQKLMGNYETQKTVADKLRSFLKQEVRTGTRGYTTWKIEPDASIQGGHDVEIISPPLSWEDAKQAVDKVLQFAYEYELETNSSTGVHFNVSASGMKRFDALKFVLLLGDEYALRVFGRSKNEFTQSQLAAVRTWVNDQLGDEETILPPAEVMATLERVARGGLRTVKYSSVNLRKLETDGFIEVRIAGGNYGEKLPQLLELLDRIVIALHAALNPEIDRKVYLKKLLKLLANSTSPSPTASALDQLAKKFKWIVNDIDTLRTQRLPKERALHFALHLITDIAFDLRRTNSRLTFAQAAELLNLLKANGISKSDVVEAASESERKMMQAIGLIPVSSLQSKQVN